MRQDTFYEIIYDKPSLKRDSLDFENADKWLMLINSLWRDPVPQCSAVKLLLLRDIFRCLFSVFNALGSSDQ